MTVIPRSLKRCSLFLVAIQWQNTTTIYYNNMYQMLSTFCVFYLKKSYKTLHYMDTSPREFKYIPIITNKYISHFYPLRLPISYFKSHYSNVKRLFVKTYSYS